MKHARTALLVIAVAIAIAHCWWFSGFTVDDGAISFSYARSLAHGQGAVIFPGGERVEGYTNFSWVALLAIGIRLGVDVFVLSHVYGAVLCVLAVLGTAALCARLRGKTSPLDGVAAIVVALIPPLAYWSMSGLEGGLYAALVVGCLYRMLVEEDEPTRAPISALFACLCALTRPDGLAVLLLAIGYRMLRGPRRLTWLATALVPTLGYFAWRYSYYAWPWPNTFYAKVQDPFRVREFFDFRAAGWTYVTGFVERYRLWALVACALPVLWWRRPGFARRLFVVLVLGALTAFPIYARGDWMSEGRFLVATLPVLCALAIVGAEIFGRFSPIPIGIAALVVVQISVVHSKERHEHYPVPASFVAQRGLHYKRLGERYDVRDRSALDGDLGGTSFYSGMPLVDLGMLADVTLARYRHDPSIAREYVHGERRPTFMRLAGFWLEDGLQTYPEFVDHYIPSGMPDITMDRRVFLETRIDPRTPFVVGDGIDVLGVQLGEHEVDVYVRVTREPAGAPQLLGDRGPMPVVDPLFPPTRWRAGEVVHVKLTRPTGALRICANDTCLALSPGANGTLPVAEPRPTPEPTDDLEVALAVRQRLGQSTVELGHRLYARAEQEEHAGNTAAAFADYALALRADPALSFARRHLEALRFATREQYHPIYEQKMEAALRDFVLAPDANKLGIVATLARAAHRPRIAADVYLATKLVPDAANDRRALADCLALDGLPDEAKALGAAKDPGSKISTIDFEDGRITWTPSGNAFTDAPTRWRPQLKERGFEGHVFVSTSPDSRTGTLRSPPLPEGVDEVCFVVGGGSRDAGVRIGAAQASGHDDWLLRSACLPATAGASIEIFDEGTANWQHVAADDFACFAHGRPASCQ